MNLLSVTDPNGSPIWTLVGDAGERIEVAWQRDDGVLEPVILRYDVPREPPVPWTMRPSHAACYAWWDRMESAPDTTSLAEGPDVVLNVQRELLLALAEAWPSILVQIDEAVHATDASLPSTRVVVDHLELHPMQRNGLGCATFRGYLPDDEDGIRVSGILSGTSVAEVATGSFSCDPPVQQELRADPRTLPPTSAEIVRWTLEGKQKLLSERYRLAQPKPQIDAVLFDHMVHGPPDEALILLKRGAIRTRAVRLTSKLIDVMDEVVMRKALGMDILRVPEDALFHARDASEVPLWVALGAPLETTLYTGDDAGKYIGLLAYHVKRPTMFASLLEAGALPTTLEPADLSPSAWEAVERHHPAWATSARSGLASQLLQAWEARGWIEVAPTADRRALARALDAAVRRGTSELADRILDLEGVEELYVDDPTLQAFANRWLQGTSD